MAVDEDAGGRHPRDQAEPRCRRSNAGPPGGQPARTPGRCAARRGRPAPRERPAGHRSCVVPSRAGGRNVPCAERPCPGQDDHDPVREYLAQPNSDHRSTDLASKSPAAAPGFRPQRIGGDLVSKRHSCRDALAQPRIAGRVASRPMSPRRPRSSNGRTSCPAELLSTSCHPDSSGPNNETGRSRGNVRRSPASRPAAEAIIERVTASCSNRTGAK